MSSTHLSVQDLWRQIEAARRQADWVAVRDYSLAILRSEAAHVPALLRLSEAHEALGDYRAALAAVLAARDCRPRQPVLIFALAFRLRAFFEMESVVDCVRDPAFLGSDEAGMLAEIGVGLSLQGELATASQLLERAIALVGEEASLLYSRGRVFEFAGDYAAAESDYRQALQKAPDDAFAHWSLSRLPEGHQRSADLDALQQALSRAPQGSRAEAVLRYALFNRFDALGDSKRAWPHLEQANRIVRGGVGDRVTHMKALMEALQTQEFPAATTAPAGDPGDPTPIFIVGLHRTGSTLLERLLGRHSQVANTGELYDFPAQLRWSANRFFPGALDVQALQAANDIDYPRLGYRYLRHVRWKADGRAFITDKLPMNYLNIGFILRALPQAKIVHTTRDPMGTCFSNLKEVFAGAAEYSYDQVEMADHFAAYRKLMAHWHRSAPGRILDVGYSELVKTPDAAMARIAAFCSLGSRAWDAGQDAPAPRAITTASSGQARGKIHQRGLYAWERYGTQLQPLAARLQHHGIDVLD